MNLSGFIDTVQGVHRPAGWWSPTRPCTGPRKPRSTCPGCCASRWAARRMPSRERPSPSRPTGAPPSWVKWARARPSSALPPPTPPGSGGCSYCVHASFDSKMEAGGGGYGAPGAGPPSSPPSPTWSGSGCPWVPLPSSPSCPGKGPSSPTAGSPLSSSAGPPPGDGWCGTSRRESRFKFPAAPPATPR